MTAMLLRLPGGEGKYNAVVRPVRHPEISFVVLIEKRKGWWILEAAGRDSRLAFPTFRALRGYMSGRYDGWAPEPSAWSPPPLTPRQRRLRRCLRVRRASCTIAKYTRLARDVMVLARALRRWL